MEKFLKSIFTTSEKKKSIRESEIEEDRDFTPPLDGRRKLSISRSGRMKQANKKRHELNVELYGEATQPMEKMKSLEYHVNKPALEQHIVASKHNRRRPSKEIEPGTQRETQKDADDKTMATIPVKTPEEEIESAFEYIDKIS